jgi:poly(hydroxyalkanoate) depolymerase family esterase
LRQISDTIARLAAAAHRFNPQDSPSTTTLDRITAFGTNPGALAGFVHIPQNLKPGAPLVVVLHGCTQSAAGYDAASGWSQLADEQGFAVLYPQQQRGNNANLCFNWFETADIRRGSGEALSIRQMISAVEDRHGIDPDQVFITGLSAGGAMAATMLAVYPEVFAGGGIIAGLPHDVGHGMVQAFDRMRGHGLPSADQLASRVRTGSNHSGPWPRISIWHGAEDKTVDPSNAAAIAAQWRGVHGLENAPATVEQIDGAQRSSWRTTDGRVQIEQYIIPGMGHGTPIKASGVDACGVSAPYMLDVGLSSTRKLAAFWGISTEHPLAQKPSTASPAELQSGTLPVKLQARRLHGQRIAPEIPEASGVGTIIENALRAAGLMK